MHVEDQGASSLISSHENRGSPFSALGLCPTWKNKGRTCGVPSGGRHARPRPDFPGTGPGFSRTGCVSGEQVTQPFCAPVSPSGR